MDSLAQAHFALADVKTAFGIDKVKTLLAAFGCEKLHLVPHGDLDALTALAKHHMDKRRLDRTRGLLERIVVVKTAFEDAKAEYKIAMQDLNAEISEARAETGYSVKQFAAAAKVRLGEQKVREALMGMEAQNFLYEKLFGYDGETLQ